MNTIRNRIKAHRRVRAGDLVPHEFNFRLHSEQQRSALVALYQETNPYVHCGMLWLKLIDGYLRRDLDADMEVDVEVLDVSDAEARTLLLSIDPLAALAQTNTEAHARLRELTPSRAEAVQALWDATARNHAMVAGSLEKAVQPAPEQFLILVECRDEQDQVELLHKFETEGLSCKALLS